MRLELGIELEPKPELRLPIVKNQSFKTSEPKPELHLPIANNQSFKPNASSTYRTRTKASSSSRTSHCFAYGSPVDKALSASSQRHRCSFDLDFFNKKMSKRASTTAFGSNNPMSLREDRRYSKGGSINPKAALKLDHLQRLALWTGGEASIPSLGAFFGHKLASTQEGLDVPPDPSMVSCQRCETILQPGFNCTIRIEKNRAKARRSKKPANFTFTQNNVVYSCHFCSERNVKRGTSRGHMKAICSLKIKKASDLKPAKSISQKFAMPKKTSANEVKVSKLKTGTPTADEENPSIAKIITSTTIVKEILTVDSPTTPMVKPVVALLDSKRKKINKSASKKRPEPEISPALTDVENSTSTTNKRRRKSWTSLKELAERNEQKKNISDLSIPFFM
ncbi:hypothetical protein ACLB2K_036935 [Fragaria x ananassa]